MRYYTPLRYPGGKATLGHYMRQIFVDNNLLDGAYVEPYAGGAAVGLELLMTGYARDVWLNDIDPAIYAFWQATLDHTDEIIELVHNTPLTIEEWKHQRSIYLKPPRRKNPVALGFATLFLNRTNRSGILDAGVIGGLSQKGRWLIDARFNRIALSERIQRLSEYRGHIHVSRIDAEEFLRTLELPTERALVYVDPPFFHKGQRLYRNHYAPKDHVRVAEVVQSELAYPWIVSYDQHPEISKLYTDRRKIQYSLQYSAQNKRLGDELLIFSDSLILPKTKAPSRFRVN